MDVILGRTRRLLILLAAAFFAVPAVAQDGVDTADARREQLRLLREAKAERLRPPTPPGRIERFLGRVQDRVEGGGGTTNLGGFRPKLGGLKSGAGLAGGVVFEPLAPSSVLYVRADAQASLERYWGAGLQIRSRYGPATLLAYGRYRHMPKEDVYGVGGDSDLQDRSNYRLNEAVGGVLAGFNVGSVSRLGTLTAGVRTSYIASVPGPGRDDDYPNTLEWARPLPIESLERSARHVAFGSWLELDGRDPTPARRAFVYLTHTEPDVIGMPLASDRGVYVLGEVVHYQSVGGAPFDFTRVTAQSQQYIPFRHGRNVFAFREYLALSRTGAGTVPIYMLPALGGAYTLRGFDLFRFRDRHALLLNAEYRWQVWLFADLALFLDAGQVYTSVEDISLRDLHTSYGAGLRLRVSGRGLARADVARSVEGTQIHLRLTSRF